MKDFLFLLLLVLLPCMTLAQDSHPHSYTVTDIKASSLENLVDSLRYSKNNDLKAKILTDIAVSYILYEANDSVLARYENILIAMSFYSTQLYYHEFQHSFGDFYADYEKEIRKRNSYRLKAMKVFLVLSGDRDHIRWDYYERALKLGKHLQKFKKINCEQIQDYKSMQDALPEFERHADDYLPILYYCGQSKVNFLTMLRTYISFRFYSTG